MALIKVEFMVTVNLYSYGIARDIVNERKMPLTLKADIVTVGDIRLHLYDKYPRLKSLASLAIGVNDEYVNDDTIVTDQDEIILIPPVSGG